MHLHAPAHPRYELSDLEVEERADHLLTAAVRGSILVCNLSHNPFSFLRQLLCSVLGSLGL